MEGDETRIEVLRKAKDITKRIYDEMSTRLTEPLTKKDIESSCQEQLHKVVEGYCTY